MSDKIIEASDVAEIFSAAVFSLVRNYVIVDAVINQIYQDNSDPDNAAFTADVAVGKSESSGGSVYFNVPLRILTDGTQAADIEIPPVGAAVLLGFRDGNLRRPQIMGYQQGTKRLWNYDQIVINGGALGGLVKAKELQQESNKDRDILLAILNILTGPPITEPGNGAPSALQQALAGAVAGKQPGTWDNLENPKITQG